jgi:hypothetical protein
LILLYIYMAAVAVVLTVAGFMEYQGLKQKISGANGFIWTMLALFMAFVLMPTVLITWFFYDGRSALMTLVFGAAWLALCGYASLRLMTAGGRAE